MKDRKGEKLHVGSILLDLNNNQYTYDYSKDHYWRSKNKERATGKLFCTSHGKWSDMARY
ncbi:hypothetical protein [Paenilisteria newyorkensis]|uniref:hypothetical protein n=1 Tax=Listeria newyorkensis TaxID=1497681 RepID=UPI0011874BC8|nr:hypothetical protein [Listeria newyorkensis]